jgi:hypothetical protein
MSSNPTVGDLKRKLADLPDDMPLFEWDDWGFAPASLDYDWVHTATEIKFADDGETALVPDYRPGGRRPHTVVREFQVFLI